jgi:HAD superfamily hydrolase (TIGR01484 family)
VKPLEACEKPDLLLSFDFDGTLHHPADRQPVPLDLFETLRELRKTRDAVWGINTGRSIPFVIEGMMESAFPFSPDWIIAREREIHLPNAFGRFEPYQKWNRRCSDDIRRLFKKAGGLLKRIRREIEEHTGAQYVEMDGDPAGLISRTEEEMEWIVDHITPMVEEVPELGWQRNSIYLRFGHRNYQKGTTLSEVMRLYDLERSQVFAMGDSHNDVEMLSPTHSGQAACPANAVDAIRELIRARGGYVAKAAHGEGVIEALRELYGPSTEK